MTDFKHLQIEVKGLDPQTFYARVQKRRGLVWLDSGMDPKGLGRFSMITYEPSSFFEITQGGQVNQDDQVLEGIDPLKALDSWLAKHESKAPLTLDLPFVGGALGYFSYDLKNVIETLPQTSLVDVDMPLCRLDHYDWVYVYNHQLKKGWLVSYHPTFDFEPILKALDQGQVAPKAPGPFVTQALTCNMTKEAYIQSIQAVKDYIRSGDIYQINFTQRFSAPCKADEVDLYYALRHQNPAPFAAFLRYDDLCILSSSPERFIEKRGDHIATRPIKGTIKRGMTPQEDEENKEVLRLSEKDQSELLMIVDLERNDLSKLAKKASVKVPELFKIETYPTVHHLVATVTASLKEGVTFSDVLKATFPGGSITGTPKIRAMQVIDELEPTARGIYTGSIGYIGVNGDFDLNIVIRTIVKKADRVYYQVGGGIVWDSTPQAEFEESLTKGLALKRTLYGD